VKTVGEIDRDGNIIVIFHPTATAAWTHLPGERYRLWTDRGGPVPEPKQVVAIPNYPLHPSEAHLRLVVNTIRREPHHWWLRTEAGRAQREFLDRRDAA
jgi:hypothetical protein